MPGTVSTRGGRGSNGLHKVVDPKPTHPTDSTVLWRRSRTLKTARDYTPDHWRHALLACLDEEAVERADAIEAAAYWASENMGLEFQRLRKDGVIVKGLKSAIRSGLRRGEIEKVGMRGIRRAVREDGG